MSRRWLLLLTCWACVQVACASTQTRSVQSFVDSPLAGEVLVSDTESWRLVALAGHRLERGEGGRLELEVSLRNLSGLDLPVEIQTVFLGPDDAPLSDELDWSKVVIPGHAEHRHTARSESAAATSFRVLIRTP